MSKANIKLSISFDFELAAPPALLQSDHDALCRQLHEALGAMVFQGMPTVTAKQLGKAGVTVLGHHHHLDAANLSAAAIARDALVAAAPHLTDDELDQLSRRAAAKAPSSADELLRFLRRQALALVNEYRMVACEVEARLTSGAQARLEGKLNLTNGSVMLGERDRQSRLQANQGAIVVVAGGGAASMLANCAGHTLSGPVIEVALAELARNRDALIEDWQRQGS
ncbi:hypothetical protein [Azoarcus olearius]|uniref:Uncharacterized protein n=1 Tax=Azoarcus sp. (strain BH72) TaxID=418699 RepID=A1K9F8_AZOSB|nr:hypothetical protein [Azoarcus olearius]ANQ86014.1 hypothetical protein dqs_2986 [Azoarcus olearius]CAL95463.1 hypothetical protein predicted by Glimmer/Critica [Azoarcus olearius]